MLATHIEHYINGRDMFAHYPDDVQQAWLGMGCFWGAERIFWQLPGVYVTSVGYAGGNQHNPDYQSVCSGRTGHVEVVHVVFHPSEMTYEAILKVFFENHDPTQGHRQGNDVGSQYRSVIYTCTAEQARQAQAARRRYKIAYGRPITTEIAPIGTYYPAEDYHQQYLAKNPQGYCQHGPTGIYCPLPDPMHS